MIHLEYFYTGIHETVYHLHYCCRGEYKSILKDTQDVKMIEYVVLMGLK